MSVTWQLTSVSSPHLSNPVEVVAAKDIPYVKNGHRFQTFSIYARKNEMTTNLIHQTATQIPRLQAKFKKPRWHVHIHGGAWRDPFLTSTSVEPLAACTFFIEDGPIDVIIGLNYTISPFPTHPSAPYDPSNGDTGQPEREAKHPDHIRDVLTALKVLRSFGLADDDFLLSGHSCGACLAFQATLQDPKHWELKEELPSPPRPFTLIGLNGLYDLVALVNGLGPSHVSMRNDYERFQGIAFGTDQLKWPLYSPARFDADMISERIKEGLSPNRVLIDQSAEDQLVPMNEFDRMRIQLEQVAGLTLIHGHRCTGKHAAPWEQGFMIFQTILDVLDTAS